MSLEMMIGCTGDACSDWVRRRNLPSMLNMVNNATNSQSLLQLRSDTHSMLNIVTAPHTIVGQLAVFLLADSSLHLGPLLKELELDHTGSAAVA